jgi:putative FmdB family regulatory protein
MPIYEYMCRDCGTRNEFLEGVTRERVEKVCSECGSSQLDKLMSMAAFTVAGGSECACGGECACESEGHGHAHGGGCGCGHCHN